MTVIDPRALEVVAPNLHHRWSGVTSTIATLVPEQAKTIAIAATGPGLPGHVPQVPFARVLAAGWSRPPDGRERVWHARRNDEMIVGVLMRDVLRQPWRLVFTSAARRDHSALTRWLLRRMDGVIATSAPAATHLRVPHVVVMHGVDTARFHPAGDRAAAWAATGLPGRYGIGCFGRLRAQKGTDVFVEAMIRLLPRHPDATAVLTGLEAAEEAAFVTGLKARVAEAGLGERIRFMGLQPAEAMPGWFRTVSLQVAPMRSEGFGLTPLEAMASGTPIVATDTGAARLLIRPGETGAVVEPGDVDGLTVAIEAYLADPGRMEAHGRAARAHVEAHHRLADEVAGIRAVYEAVRGPAVASGHDAP